MNKHIAVAAVAAFATLGLAMAAPSFAADVGVSVSISQPGVYGRVDIGRFPQPALVMAQPVLVQRPAYRPAPVYMWVPPAHRTNWRHHCGAYGACGVPVYFVQDRWYNDHVRYVDRRDRRDWHDHHPHHDHGHRGRGRGHGNH